MTTDATLPPVYPVCRTCHVAHHPTKPHVFTGIAAGAAGGKAPCAGCRDRNAIIERMTEERAPLVARIDTLEQEQTIDRELIRAQQAQIKALQGGTTVAKAPKRAKRRKRKAATRAKAKAQPDGAQPAADPESATRLSNPRPGST